MANFFIKKATTQKVIGPLSGRQVKKFCFETRIKGRDYISTDLKNWRQVSDIPDLYSEDEDDDCTSIDIQREVEVPGSSQRLNRTRSAKSGGGNKKKGHEYWNKRPKRATTSSTGSSGSNSNSVLIIVGLIVFIGGMFFFIKHSLEKDKQPKPSNPPVVNNPKEENPVTKEKPDDKPEEENPVVKEKPDDKPKEENPVVKEKPDDKDPEGKVTDNNPFEEKDPPKEEPHIVIEKPEEKPEEKPVVKKTNPLDILDSKKLNLVAHAVIDDKANDVIKLFKKGADPNFKTGEHGYTPLVWAFKKNHKQVIHKLIDYPGVDLDAKDELGNSILHWAMAIENEAQLNQLIRKKVNLNLLNNKKQSPFHLALINKNEEAVKRLIENNVDVNLVNSEGNNEIHLIAEHDDLFTLNYLMGRDVELNYINLKGLTAYDIAKKSKSKKILDLLKQHKALSGRDYFNHIYYGRLEEIEKMLKIAPQFTLSISNKSTSFQRALTTSKKEMSLKLIQILLQHNDDINMKDLRGNTVLHSAVDHKRYSIIDNLLELKADSNVQNESGQSPLHRLASHKGSSAESTLEMLIEQGANINLKDTRGVSCAEICLRYDNSGLLQILLDNNFDVNSITSEGKTLLDFATTYNKDRCLRLIKRQGGLTHVDLLKKLDN